MNETMQIMPEQTKTERGGESSMSPRGTGDESKKKGGRANWREGNSAVNLLCQTPAGIVRALPSIRNAAQPRCQMAARLGVEPRQNESESFVLPLHHRAVCKNFCQRRRMEPAMGFEPATACLQNRCSTIELHRRNSLRFFISQHSN